MRLVVAKKPISKKAEQARRRHAQGPVFPPPHLDSPRASTHLSASRDPTYIRQCISFHARDTASIIPGP